jgi:hypothetical protein
MYIRNLKFFLTISTKNHPPHTIKVEYADYLDRSGCSLYPTKPIHTYLYQRTSELFTVM